jgi:hypothetical protein
MKQIFSGLHLKYKNYIIKLGVLKNPRVLKMNIINGNMNMNKGCKMKIYKLLSYMPKIDV